ncbi:MAG: hypothetical protein CV089_03530 [Nitrospira sp. WS110]|nr:hypothetical protein [Nitrospira sp. WS110]
MAGNNSKRRRIGNTSSRNVTRRGIERSRARAGTIPELQQVLLAHRATEEKIRTSERLLLSISRIQTLYIDEARPDALFHVLVEELLTITDSEYGFIGDVLRTAEQMPYLRTQAITDLSWNEETKALMAQHASNLEFRNLNTLFGQVMTTGCPVMANDSASDPRAGGLPPGHPPIHAFLGLPIYRGEVLIGLLGIANRPGGYDEAIVAYLEPFLSTCGQVLEGYRNRGLRTEAEAALREATTAVELTMEGISRLDDSGRYVFVNHQYAALLGYRPDELVGQSWDITVHPDDRASVLTSFTEMLATGKAETDLRGVKKDGSLIWTHAVLAKPNGPEGKVSGHFCFVRGITERKREEALQAAERQALELVAKRTPLNEVLAFICRTIESHTASMFCSVMLGTGDGAHLLSAAGPSLPEEYNQLAHGIPIGPNVGSCDSAASFRKVVIADDITTNPLWKDYASVPLTYGIKPCWSQPILSSTGTLLGTFTAYYRDTREPEPSDLKVVERAGSIAAVAIEHAKVIEALKESESRFQAFMRHSPAVTFIKDRAGCYLYINPTFEKRFRFSLDEVRGRTDADLMPPPVVAELNENDRRVWFTGDVIEVEETVPTPDGQSDHWLVLKFPLMGIGGEPLLGGVAVDITERKRAVEELRASERRQEFLLSATSVVIYSCRATGDYGPTFMTENVADVMGYRREECLADSRWWVDGLHPDDRVRVLGELPRLFECGRHTHEYRFRHKDGSYRWMRDELRVVYDAEGCPVELVGCWIDVTEQREAEEHLHRTRFAMDQAVDAVYWIDPQARILYANDAASMMLGYTAEEFLRMTVHDLNPDYPPELWPGWWDEARVKKEISLETIHLTKDGRRIPIDMRVAFLAYGGQEFHCAFVRDIGARKQSDEALRLAHMELEQRVAERTAQLALANQSLQSDIAERKRTEEALRESELRYKLLTEATFDGIAIHDQGVLLEVNPGLERMFGYQSGELIGRSILDLVADESRDRVVANMQAGVIGPYEAMGRRKDGSTFPGEVVVRPYHFRGKEVRLVAGRDITERKYLDAERLRYTAELEHQVAQRTAEIAKLEAQRAQTEKLAAMGRLAAGVAHEINNPIAGIKNAFTLVKQAVDPTHPHYEFAGMIDREIARVSSIVQNMYQLYRPESGRAEPVDLQTMTNDIQALFAKRLQQRRLKLVIEADPYLKRLCVSRGDLLQVLLNLVNNAIDCSREASRVTLSLREEPEMVRISVSDEGSGIPPEILPHIFDPFYTTKMGNDQKSMGLGLSVSRSLVMAMGGTIEVETQSNQGSTFSILIPRNRAVMNVQESGEI